MIHPQSSRVLGRRPTRAERFPAELLSSKAVRLLRPACSSRAPTGIRNRALIAVLYRGGLRISEALALHVKDVDQAAGTVTVLHGKGDQRRTVGMDRDPRRQRRLRGGAVRGHRPRDLPMERGHPRGTERADARFRSLRARVEEARAAAEVRDVAITARAAETDWRAAAWRLSRRAPARHGLATPWPSRGHS